MLFGNKLTTTLTDHYRFSNKRNKSQGKRKTTNQRAKSIPKQRDGDNHSSNNDSNSNT